LRDANRPGWDENQYNFKTPEQRIAEMYSDDTEKMWDWADGNDGFWHEVFSSPASKRFCSLSNGNRTEKRMSYKFSVDEVANEKELQFARLNLNAEVEPWSFDEWIIKRYGKGTILKETIGDWIVTLSFTGIGHFLESTDPPAFWEVAEYNKRSRRVNDYRYASEKEASESFFDSVERYRSEES
jgi:hypothetical protein